jgi:hypothetical protein
MTDHRGIAAGFEAFTTSTTGTSILMHAKLCSGMAGARPAATRT